MAAIAGVFDTGDTIESYGGLLGWARQWTPNLKTSIAAGPQVTDGNWGPTADVAISYADRQLTLSLSFVQGSSLVVGAAEPEAASTLRATATYQVSRQLAFSGFGYIQRTAPLNDLGSSDATMNYTAGLSVSYQITSWMNTYLKYQYTLETGGAGHVGDIPDNQVILGLTFSYPFVF